MVVFDVDGVLLDTLTSHLKICEDINKELCLGLNIPDEEKFKKNYVRNGCKINPMNYFFKTLGFKGEYLDKANKKYDESFSSEYNQPLFDGVIDMLIKLKTNKIPVGIVSSNSRSNIKKALGNSFSIFNKDCIFTKDNSSSKEEALINISNILELNIKEILYVGDQNSDYVSSKNVGSQFLGVSYGWGISVCDSNFYVAETTKQIFEYIVDQQ